MDTLDTLANIIVTTIVMGVRISLGSELFKESAGGRAIRAIKTASAAVNLISGVFALRGATNSASLLVRPEKVSWTKLLDALGGGVDCTAFVVLACLASSNEDGAVHVGAKTVDYWIISITLLKGCVLMKTYHC